MSLAQPLTRMITSFFGVGLLPKAPGTFGSLAALPAAYGLHYLGGYMALGIGIVSVFALGLWATDIQTRGTGNHDPGEIVIDEVAGQWIALLPLSVGLTLTGAAPHIFPYPGWITAFLLFRLFDIWKPWPVRSADRMTSPLGVMLDDVIAGLMAALVVALAALLAHALV